MTNDEQIAFTDLSFQAYSGNFVAVIQCRKLIL